MKQELTSTAEKSCEMNETRIAALLLALVTMEKNWSHADTRISLQWFNNQYLLSVTHYHSLSHPLPLSLFLSPPTSLPPPPPLSQSISSVYYHTCS